MERITKLEQIHVGHMITSVQLKENVVRCTSFKVLGVADDYVDLQCQDGECYSETIRYITSEAWFFVGMFDEEGFIKSRLYDLKCRTNVWEKRFETLKMNNVKKINEVQIFPANSIVMTPKGGIRLKVEEQDTCRDCFFCNSDVDVSIEKYGTSCKFLRCDGIIFKYCGMCDK